MDEVTDSTIHAGQTADELRLKGVFKNRHTDLYGRPWGWVESSARALSITWHGNDGCEAADQLHARFNAYPSLAARVEELERLNGELLTALTALVDAARNAYKAGRIPAEPYILAGNVIHRIERANGGN